MLKKFLSLLTRTEKRNAAFVLVLLFFLTVCEFISIGLILPFIAIVTDPEIIQQNEKIKYVFEMFNPGSTDQFKLQMGGLLLALFVLKFILASVADRKRIIISKRLEHDLSCRFLRANLSNEYPFFLKHPPSFLHFELLGEIPQVAFFYDNLLILISESTVAMAIICLFFIASIKATLFLLIGVLICAALNFAIVKQWISECSEKREKFGLKRSRWSLQNYNGIKDLKIFNNESVFLDTFKEYSEAFLKNDGFIKFIQQLQYRMIELFAFLLMTLVLMFLIFSKKDNQEIIPLLALFSAGTFKMLPSVMKSLLAVTKMKYADRAVKIVHKIFWESNKERDELLRDLGPNDLVISVDKRITMKKEIRVDIHSFVYEERPTEILKNVSITFEKNKMIGIVGGSGSGKTTLIDILLGLNTLKNGAIFIDGEPINPDMMYMLRNNIGYVPQKIFLWDKSIQTNITFGSPEDKINHQALNEAIEKAQLKDFIKSLPDGIQTVVGEFGVKVSGGQLQRIGIARALYRDPEILILDEATSNLDSETEMEFMNSILSLRGEKTIIISTHLLSTIQHCDKVYLMKDGIIEDVGKYENLLKRSDFLDIDHSMKETI